MEIDQLNHVAIHVSNLDRSIEFYRDVLELKQVPRPDFDFPGAWFSLGPNQELHLIARSGSGGYSVPDERHMAFRVKDIAVAQADLEAREVHFAGPKNRPDGVPQIFLHDPDGHVIELTQIDGA